KGDMVLAGQIIAEADGFVSAKPSGAFYIFIDVSAYYGKSINGRVIDGSLSFADEALKYGVAVMPGIAFGDDKCIRISYTVSTEDILEGVKRLKDFVKELK
ncbi:MAG: aspartate aminotransferase, partial [Clostridia bacterium]|nr:aspartate aminotransferase [Clostridia bacterium]